MSPELITYLEMHIWAVPPATYGSPWKNAQGTEALRNTCVCRHPPTHTHTTTEHLGQAHAWTPTHTGTQRSTFWPWECRGVGALLWVTASSGSPSAGPRTVLLQVPPNTHTHYGIFPWALMKMRGHRDSHPRPQYTQNVQDHPEPDLPQILRSQRGAMQVRGHEPWTPGHLPFYRMGN